MRAVVVRCTSCFQPSRVPTQALGLTVACPRCGHHFTALQDESTVSPVEKSQVVLSFPSDGVPVVHRLQKSNTRPEHPDEIPTVHPPQPGGGAVALALLPVGVPLLWLVISLLVPPSEFSFVAPVAIAVGTVGLGFGLASIRRWSFGLRMRLLLALTALSYLSGAVFYFAQESWLERVREVAAFTGLTWREFKPEDGTFRLTVPGVASEATGPVEEWKLTARQFVDPKLAVDRYVVAYGEAPAGLGKWTDKPSREAWFSAARESLAAASGGKLLEERLVSVPNSDAREYEFDLSGGRHRVVRLVRNENRVVYLAVEGQYLTADRHDVKRYLRSLKFFPTPEPGRKAKKN